MASPQVDNGFTRIANEIMEVVQHHQFTVNEYKVIMCVWRFTYGFSRKEHKMSITFFENHTGLARNRVNDSLKSLLEDKVLISKKDGQRTAVYSFNKNYEEWTRKKYKAFAGVQVVTSVQDVTSYQDVTTKDSNSSVQDVTSSQDVTSVQDVTSNSVQDVTSLTDTVVYNSSPKKERVKENSKEKDIKQNFAAYGYAPVYLTEREYQSLVDKYGDDTVGAIIFDMSKWLDENPKQAKSARYKDYAHERVAEWIARENGEKPPKQQESKRTYANAADLLTPEELKEDDDEGVDDENAQWL